ncbi:tripartite tricarboxylate transporter substrate binding protein [Reyranella sp.]|uniref:Bug family tripartite tricarboxylate transporter substrate binding protein n=1 Tax=Reyranella sp. TaxID=1929291 RepID=UPI0012144BF5|nr:tripartite tricarboxylate transporter substrate binding protein [Reyranella sp.]TAJ89771.1 MAG: tripartite tricarboxylate transporter substrate binding protein [Reyranella sp.]
MTERRNVIGRRTLIGGIAGGMTAAVLGAPAIVSAQGTYPNKAVRYINPFPAGGATDTLSRLFCAKLSELSGQQWIVENRGGSGGNVGMEALMQSPPDGYTLGLGGIASHAISPTLYAKLPFNAKTDFTFVSRIWQLPNMLVVNLDIPAKTVAELIAFLKKNPGKYSYGSAGNGTTLHLSGELFKMMAGVDILHVPYRGAAPAMQDLLAGQIHMIFDNIPGALAQTRPGKVRPLGVTSKERTPVVPDVPAIAETLPGFDINSWTTLTGPAKLPPDIIARLSELSKKALESEDLKAKFLDLAATATWSSPADTAAYRDSEEARLAPIIKASGARVE